MASLACYDFTAQEMRDLEFVYKLFDVQGGGIESEDVRRALRLLGFKVSRKTVLQMLQDLKVSTGGMKSRATDFAGFLEMVAKLQGISFDQHEEILQAFSYMDTDQDGFLSLGDLYKYSRKAGLTKSDVREMLAEADKDGDGKISKEEYLTIMRQTNLFRIKI